MQYYFMGGTVLVWLRASYYSLCWTWLARVSSTFDERMMPCVELRCVVYTTRNCKRARQVRRCAHPGHIGRCHSKRSLPERYLNAYTNFSSFIRCYRDLHKLSKGICREGSSRVV